FWLLIDREQGGAQFYRSVGLDFQAVFTIKDIQEWMISKK
ncbi:MAG: orotate phosphoribosyltransferase, partial [Microcoleus sp. SU_5_3]|nr:orotate phosphoribosyltransferase [Microcoleus sp. SU_5_3]